MGKNFKQVLVLVISVITLIFAMLPMTVYAADNGMTFDVEVFDSNGNKYASGKMPEIEFVIRDSKNNIVTTVTSNNKGTLKSAIQGLDEYEAYYLDVSDNMLEKGYFFYFDNTENGVWNGRDFSSDYQKNQENGTSGLQFMAMDGFTVTELLTAKSATKIRIIEHVMPLKVVKSQLNNANIKIADAEFSLYKYTGSKDIFTENFYLKNGKVYAGTTELSTNYYTLVKTFTTNDDGVYDGINIPCGKYLLFETKTPDGYFENTSGTSIVAIPFTLDKWNQAGETVNVYNEKKCSVTLQKTDENGVSLQGMIFDLQRVYTSNGTVTYTNWLTQLKTDANGKIEVDNLPYGTYRFVEQTQKGWRKVNPITFVVDGSTEAKTNATVKFVNKPIKLTAYKYDVSTKETVENAKFSLFRIEDDTRTLVGNYTSDKNGMIFDLTKVEAGNYVLVETSAPGGYVLDSATCTNGTVTVSGNEMFFTVSDDINSQDLTIKAYNRAPQSHSLSIEKLGKIITSTDSQYDEKANAYVYTFKTTEGLLKGATFRLTAKTDIYSGNRLVYKAGTVVATIVTDGENLATINNLYPGTYILSEMSFPTGYEKVYEDAEIVISDSNKTVSVENSLKKVKFSIVKEDNTSGLPIEGAIFGIFAKEDIYSRNALLIKKDSCIAVLTTDSNGTATTGDIYAPIGEYYAKEIYAPNGYHLNTNTITKEYNGYDREVSFKFTNERQLGNIIVTKKGDVLDYDSLADGVIKWTEGNLSGVEFTVYAKNDIVSPDVSHAIIYKAGEKVASKTTDDTGIVRFENLPIGEYTVKETKIPVGYLQDDNPQRVVTVTSTKDVYETFYNKRRSTDVVINKTDGENTPIEGAVFGLYNNEDIKDTEGNVVLSAQTLIAALKSNRNGVATLTDIKLPIGHYTIKEISAPTGYCLSTETFEVNAVNQATTHANYSYTFDVVNKPYTLIINKVDGTDKSAVIGATLTLYRQDGSVYDTWVTDGKDIVVKPIPVGEYVLKETETPIGYQTSADINISITKDKLNTTVTMVDDRISGSIVITKYKANSTTTIANVTFALKDSSGKVVAEGTTDKNGIVTFSNIPVGNYANGKFTSAITYILEETKVPTGYIKAPKSEITFDVNGEVNNGVITEYYDVYNDYTKLRIVKIDAETREKLVGAHFALYDANDNIVAKWEEDGTSIYEITELAPGTYKLVETKVPDGYISMGDIEVVITETADVIEVIVENKFDDYDITVSKIDQDGTPVAGAHLELRDSNNKVVDAWLSNGKPHTINLLPGTYTIVETDVPDGYLPSDPQTFTLKNGGVSTNLHFDIVNAYTTVEISKFDKVSNTHLKGAKLHLEDKNGNVIAEWISDGSTKTLLAVPVGTYTLVEDEAPNGYLTAKSITITVKPTQDVQSFKLYNDYTKLEVGKYDKISNELLTGAKLHLEDKDGKVVQEWTSSKETYRINNLPSGTYTLVEDEAPIGYLKSEPITFELKATGDVQVISMYDDYTKLEISKLDKVSNKLLAGAKLHLEDEHGNIVAEWTSTEDEYRIDYLTPGIYTLIEDEAPKGYLKSEPVTFELKAISDVQVVSMKDDYTKLEVSKLDKISSNLLKGATLRLEDIDGNIVAEWISSETPYVIEKLAPGTYVLVEHEAPKGYVIAKSITFELEAIGEVQVIAMENDYTKLEIAKLDKVSGKLLAGAKLHLEDENGNIVAEWTSTNEVFTINKLIPGTYTLVEDEVPSGYLKADPVTFTLEATGEIQSTSIKDDYTKIVISKFEKGTSKFIAGAKLHLEDKNGNIVAEWITTNEAHTIYHLAPGEYKLVEDEAPIGYLIANPIVITIKETGEIQEFVMEDDYTKLEISKLDIVSGELLEGAKLHLEDTDGNIIAEWISTDKPYFIKGLEPGVYTLVEDMAPLGYLKTESVTFELKATGDVQKVSMKDDYTKLEISKLDIVSGELLEGAKLHLEDANGNIIAEWISTDKPYFIKGLEPGVYILVEDMAPLGYLKTESVKFELEPTGNIQKVTMKDDYTKLIINKLDTNTQKPLEGVKLHLEDKNGNIVAEWITGEKPYTIQKLQPGTYTLVEDKAPNGYIVSSPITFELKATGETQIITMYNDYTKLEVSKLDKISKNLLEGAKLHLEDAKGNIVAEWVSGKTPYVIEKLVPGIYTLVEDEAPNGYLKSEPVTFELKATTDVQTISMEDDYTKITISKLEKGTDKYVVGAKMHLEDENGNIVAEWVTTDTTYVINHLLTGKYTLVEDEAPAGYIIAEPITITVTETGDIQVFVMEDDYTKLEISKFETGTTTHIAGAKLHLEDKNGNIIAEWVTTDKAFTIDHLLTGEYVIVEDEAPAGYIIAKPVTIIVTETGEIQKFAMEDDYTKIQIFKYKDGTTEFVVGAKMHLEDADGNIIAEWTTTNEAYCIDHLLTGTYKLVEDEAPEGFDIAEPIEIIVTATGEIQEFVMYDKVSKTPETPDAPPTGDTTNIPLCVGLMLSSLIAMAGLVLVKKKENF